MLRSEGAITKLGRSWTVLVPTRSQRPAGVHPRRSSASDEDYSRPGTIAGYQYVHPHVTKAELFELVTGW